MVTPVSSSASLLLYASRIDGLEKSAAAMPAKPVVNVTTTVGAGVGLAVGAGVVARVGLAVGAGVGVDVGRKVGAAVGTAVGVGVGGVGEAVGTRVGAAVGAGVGVGVGTKPHHVYFDGAAPHLRVSQHIDHVPDHDPVQP